MYQSRWRPEKTVLHLFPHWNWQEGSEVDLWAYYNNADEVELFVNGKSQGVRRPDSTSYHASWRVTCGLAKIVETGPYKLSHYEFVVFNVAHSAFVGVAPRSVAVVVRRARK
mgnify:CR=1 FL=1